MLRTLALALPLLLTDCSAQPAGRRPAPFPCEGCEIVDRAPADLTSTARMAGPDTPGERLVITGRVVGPDGQPAPGVVLYLHQTGADGLYGHAEVGVEIQAWLRTDADGGYRVETVRPGPYPSGGLPAHVHVYVGEGDREAYYVNDIVFAGDPEVTDAYRASLLPATDDGIVTLRREDARWRGERDIVLIP